MTPLYAQCQLGSASCDPDQDKRLWKTDESDDADHLACLEVSMNASYLPEEGGKILQTSLPAAWLDKPVIKFNPLKLY